MKRVIMLHVYHHTNVSTIQKIIWAQMKTQVADRNRICKLSYVELFMSEATFRVTDVKIV
jgi:hypothetical protein